MIRYRALLIAAGYPDGNDCDALKSDPAFKIAVGRLPESGEDLSSQPTISGLEDLPGATALKRMMAAMVELFCDSFEAVPRRILLDIDDTEEDAVHGGQQLALWNAHYDSRCFLPIHIYEATTGKPVAIIPRPGKIPDGAEVALVLRHVIGRIRARWPAVEIVVRGDSHYGRPEAMAWCERNRIGYIFGLAGTGAAAPGRPADRGRRPRAPRWRSGKGPPLQRFPLRRQKLDGRAPRHRPRRGRSSRCRQPLRRHQSAGPAASALRQGLLRQRAGREPDQGAQAAPASDRTSCSKATANQFRLLIHTAAYWLMLSLRGLARRNSFWREAQFDTIRLCLIKVAARVTEMVVNAGEKMHRRAGVKMHHGRRHSAATLNSAFQFD